MDVKTPAEVIAAAEKIGCAKVKTSSGNYRRLALLSVMAGIYIAFGGILSLTVGFGFPGVTAANPAMQKLLSGAMFPIGLILVVVLGAELFTGNNALLIPSLMKGKYSAGAVLKNWLLVYFGNFAGALAFTYLMVYMCGLTASDPYRSAIIGIAQAKVAMPWSTVFLKGIGANWCVCLAVWLALSGHNLLEKMAGCWLPVMAFVALGYEHCIANMFFIPAGMLEGADVSIGQFVSANLIPATLGNIVGGALLVGCVHAYLHSRPKCD
ncbi:MAG: formate/nitrite transporter family protein [Muribaculaceae bacterium]|nr:formate/nitrite transporter family protein [Muribaculaceae bacterium]